MSVILMRFTRRPDSTPNGDCCGRPVAQPLFGATGAKRGTTTRMNRLWNTLRVAGMATLTLGALTTSARANPVLDFETGLANQGGQVLLFSETNFAQSDGYLPTTGIGSAGTLFTFTSGTFWDSSRNSD